MRGVCACVRTMVTGTHSLLVQCTCTQVHRYSRNVKSVLHSSTEDFLSRMIDHECKLALQPRINICEGVTHQTYRGEYHPPFRANDETIHIR